MNTFSLADFDFELPKKLIAQQPATPRDSSRLLVYDRAAKSITDTHFHDIDQYLVPNTTLVMNNSKVEKCRLRFGSIEIFITQTHDPTTVEGMVRPGKKFKQDDRVELSDGLWCRVKQVLPTGLRVLELSLPIDDTRWDQFRLTPLPPYIAQNEQLADRYQTVYAKPLGSKAAPTAGLHFTQELLERVSQSHATTEVTLHVGLGTFAPIVENDVSKHVMHSEWYDINKAQAEQINAANHITAVGTTTVRVLESAARDADGAIRPQSGETSIFITPGYQFRGVHSLVTNFHLPKSTLLLLVAAFIGDPEELHRVYRHAVLNEYRFYSFGDAMLIV